MTALTDRPHDMVDHRPEAVMHPTTKVAGPEGHPFHPMLVTVPIGAWICSFVFDVGSYMSDDEVMFSRGAFWLICIGIVGAAVAAVFGMLDGRSIPKGTPAYHTATAHMALNTFALAIWVGNAILRAVSWDDVMRTEWWGITLTAIGLVIVAASGYLGGRLAYHYGVRVAEPERQAEGFADQPHREGLHLPHHDHTHDRPHDGTDA